MELPNGKIIVLCGSTRFKKLFEEWCLKLTLAGNIVISLPCFTQTDNITLTKKEVEMIVKIHYSKILLCDEIFVINPNNYIGKSTSEEILYAKSKDKGVRYLTDYISK